MQTYLRGLRRLLWLNLDGGGRGTGLHERGPALLARRHHQAHRRGVDLSNGTQLTIGPHDVLLAAGTGRDEGGLVLRRGSAQHHGSLRRQQTGGGHVLDLQQSSVRRHHQPSWHQQLLADEINLLQNLSVLEQELLGGLWRRLWAWLVHHNALDARTELELLWKLGSRGCCRCSRRRCCCLLVEQSRCLAGDAGRDLGRDGFGGRATGRRSMAHGALAFPSSRTLRFRRTDDQGLPPRWLLQGEHLLRLLLLLLLLWLLHNVTSIGQRVEKHCLRLSSCSGRARLRGDDLVVQKLGTTGVEITVLPLLPPLEFPAAATDEG